MNPRIPNYCLEMKLINVFCQYPKHRNRLLNISHIVDITKNSQDPAKATANTKTSQKKSSPSRKRQAPLSEERTNDCLIKEILEVRLSNLDTKYLSKKVEKIKTENIKNYCNVWAKITSDHLILDIAKNGLKINLNNVMLGKAPPLHHCKQEEVLVPNFRGRKTNEKRSCCKTIIICARVFL